MFQFHRWPSQSQATQSTQLSTVWISFARPGREIWGDKGVVGHHRGFSTRRKIFVNPRAPGALIAHVPAFAGTIVRSSFSLADHHPGYAKAIGQHAKSLGKESLPHRHSNLTIFGQCVENFLGF